MNKIQLKRLLIVFLVLACIAAIIEILLLISLLISLTSYIETIFAFIILIGLILEFLYVLKLIVVWVIKGKQMIDKDHAPEGYYAVKEEKKNSCVGCDFYRPVEICSKSKFCMAGSRPDDTNVILKKKENYMSKIYSAVDAEDAEHLIGKEVYCGDTLTGIKEHGKKGVLKSILYGYNNFRFLVDGLSRDNWNLIQEAEQPTYRKIETIEEAETFFGKVARNKDGTMIFTVSKAFSVQRGAVFINGHSAWKLFEDYTINGKPFGIAVNEQ